MHASASAAGLQRCLDLLAPGGEVLELSRYGTSAVSLALGGAFHSGRLAIIASQVGTVAAARRGTRSRQDRLSLALQLLHDPAYDCLLDGVSAFTDLPTLLPALVDRPGLCHLIRYESAAAGTQTTSKGGVAAAESQNAAGRLKHLPASDLEDAAALHELARLFTATDARIASAVERGFEDKLYVVAVKPARPCEQEIEHVSRQHQSWVPVTSPVQTDLVPLVRGRLRPIPPKVTGPPAAVESRRSYEALLAEQPGSRPLPGPVR
ncbi:MAG: hypothetical protein ABI873_06390 [Marmoricola sp.]